MSTFHGLEMARQALFAQRSALYTTGHNISNVNTEGYSRQRINFQTASPYPPAASRTQSHHPGQMGTGVDIGSVQRIRNQFLDFQYRAENGKMGYWNEKAEALSRMEELLNEPSESGLAKTMDEFWQSLQDLAVNPDNSGARSVVVNRGLAVAESFNHISKSLHSIRTDLHNQISVMVNNDPNDNDKKSTINSLLKQIDEINEQVQKIEPHGYLPNDLYDKRDLLIDELSQIVNIQVEYHESSDSSLKIADGLVAIKLVDSSGQPLKAGGNDVYAIEIDADNNRTVNEFNIEFSTVSGSLKEVTAVQVGNTQLNLPLQTIGALQGLIEAYGSEENGTVIGDYPTMLGELDTIAKQLADAFNAQHQSGRDNNGQPGVSFFTFDNNGIGSASQITINTTLINDPNLVAAGAANMGSRNGDNALALAKVFDEKINALDNASIRDYYASVIGKMGVQAREANRMTGNTEILLGQVERERLSTSAVSLDEEMSNMIKFQHAYNAAARSMTAVDELLDRIINNMGLVGR
ncbi:flagellar hook-associated protein FlgK [Virgibacillus sp. W0430]|uniref:flagellar hook-associated protein FlgK n=1 Tax=Virgibacillus sp. W0430 TaxID=3391580 RepID=UPI003F473309